MTGVLLCNVFSLLSLTVFTGVCLCPSFILYLLQGSMLTEGALTIGRQAENIISTLVKSLEVIQETNLKGREGVQVRVIPVTASNLKSTFWHHVESVSTNTTYTHARAHTRAQITFARE